jgi:hypothetical protein
MRKRAPRSNETHAPTSARKSLSTKTRGRLTVLLILVAFTAMIVWTSSSSGNSTGTGSAGTTGQEKPSASGARRPRKDQPSLATDKGSYLADETIILTGTNWVPGEAVTIIISASASKTGTTLQATADKSGSFTITSIMPDARADGSAERTNDEKTLFEADESASETSGGVYTAIATGASSRVQAQAQFTAGVADHDGERLLEQEGYWIHRLSYPTGRFNPEWVRQAAEQDARIERGIPAGRKVSKESMKASPLALNPNGFTALGPQPERMTGCSGCFDYTTTAGRINDIKIDPVTPTVAYAASVGGGVWKTTNCCTSATTWSPVTDDALISTTSIDSITIDPNNHATIYAGTGDLNYGSFSMGSQGILKSTDAGATWTVLGASIFGAALPVPVGQFPQYQAVGKVRVDPNNSNNVVVGTKTGLYLSYDGGTNWTGPCLTNSFATQRQDITGLELTNLGGTTRIVAAVGVRGFATTVQYNLDQNGANGLYKGTMPASGCPSDFTSIASNVNGFVNGATNMNAGSGSPYVNATTGNQLGRIDIAVAPSDPNYLYAQVGSITANNNSGCGNVAGCQLGVWSSIDGGNNWSFMTGSAGASLAACGTGALPGAAGSGDYPQNWYDQAVAVDPNDPNRIFVSTFDVWLATRTGTSFYDVTCGYTGVSPKPVHVDQHALAFVPGSSSNLLLGNDGGIHGTTNANLAAPSVQRPTWFNMDTGLNTIEFYSGDISGNFATSASPSANGGAQDNGPSSVTFAGSPAGPVQWQMGLGGDGFFARIDPVGTGTSLRYWQGNNSGGLSRCISNCTSGGAAWSNRKGGWGNDQQSFILPFELFHGDTTNPANDCGAPGATTGCGHLIAGTVRVWETVTGATATNTWYVNSPDNLTKGTLGNRSFINQLAFEPKDQKTVIVGTNDGNVQIGRGLGSGSGPTRAAGTITLTTGGALAGETFVIGSQTFTWQTGARTGTGQVQINSSTTTAGNNIVAAITADLPGVVTAARSGATVVVTAASTGTAGNSIAFTESSTNMTMNGSGTLGATTAGSDGVAVWVDVTGSNTVLPNRPVLDVAFDPTTTTAPIAYAAVGGFNENTPSQPGHVLRVVCTANCGSFTWTDKSGSLPNIPVDSIIANPNFPQQVFAGTDFGLYYTDDITAATPVWNRFNNGLPNVMIWDMQIDRGNTTLSLWTRSRGAYAWPLPQGRVNPLSQTITVNTHAPATAMHGSMFVVNATASSGLPVTYSSAGACTNSGATFTMTGGTGTCTVKYDQAGDSNYSPATQVIETVTAQDCIASTNVALASYGSTAVASSEYSAQYQASGAIDGEKDGNNWGNNSGWNDSTAFTYPDNVQVNFHVTQTIGEIDVYTLKDDFNSGSIVNDTTTFSGYGITNFNVQYWTGAAWADVPGGAVTGNNLVKRKFIFPDVATDKIRVVVNDAADHAFSRVVEIAAYSCSAVPVPTPTPPPCLNPANNVAAASFGATAVASSEYSAQYQASGAIDGEHDGNNWGNNGGWNDATSFTYPDNIQVNLNVMQTLREIDVYTLKDDFNSGSTVNDTTTFSGYGITNFNVQYWTGAAWADVPGGAVTGNNLVKRKFIFADISTDKIRVVVNDAADHAFSRIVEIAAYSCTPVPVPTPTPSPTPTPCANPSNNVALASNGSTAVASSEYSAQYQASGAIDGEKDGNNWGNNSGWNDSTAFTYPDNVQVNFNTQQTLREIDVYTLKDDFNSGSVVTDTTTFNSYGITNFNVQYWTGAAWADVPGGAVTGNNLVKRKFIFADITTDKIRVVVNDAADHAFSRVVEIAAYACMPVAVRCVNNGGTGGCFPTIQAAVNAANPGDIINVAPGIYPELVTVNKSVILRGAQAGVDARTSRTGLPATESVVTGNNGSTSFYVTASDVTIDGFTVQGTTNGNQFGASIDLGGGTSGAHVLDNIIQNNIVGLYLSNNSASDRAVIQRNLIRNNNQPGPAQGTGIYTDQFVSGGNLTNVLIDNNLFTGNDDAGIDFSSTNLNSQSNVTISNNEFDSNFRAMLMFYLSSSEITGNNIHNSNGASSADIRIFDGNSNLSITCNTITNGAGRGMRASRIVASDNSSNIAANYNNINGNAVAGLVVDSGSYTGIFNAENNWWGSPTGPTIASNPGGTGDAIMDPDSVVDYTPFATAATSCPMFTGSSGNGSATSITSASAITIR